MVFMLPLIVGGLALPPHHPQHRAPRDLLRRIGDSNPSALHWGGKPAPARRPFKAGYSVNPIDFGADPTGRKDSWAALTSAIGVCLNQSALSPNGNFPGDTSFGNGKAIRDMGGCDVDLGGGEYLISKSLHLPEYNANMQFGRGSLVASKNFEGDFLFVIGIQGSCRVPQGSCNIDINFPELFLDGSHVASGMQINNVMGVTIGPGGYFLNFTNYGLQINGGHEVMMERTWMGETNFDFDHEKYNMPPNATAIQINGNDHYILNTIVFSAKIGVEVNGAADYIQGVHVWFPDNHAVAFPDTRAFHVTGTNNRFHGCYIDGGRAVFEGKGLSRNVWEHGFECCQRGSAAPGTPSSGIVLVGDSLGPGLQIINNEFGGGTVFHYSSLDNYAQALRGGFTGDCGLNVSVANKECQGLKENGAGNGSESACAAACCAQSGCSVYQYCAAGTTCDGATGTAAQCWTGEYSDCGDGKTRMGWVGMGKGSPAPAPSTVKVQGVRIVHNSNSKTSKSTQATQTLTQTNATKWAFNFCDQLLLPQIALVRVNVIADSGFPRAVARPPQGCQVTVETDVAVTGTVTVDVDSSEPTSTFN